MKFPATQGCQWEEGGGTVSKFHNRKLDRKKKLGAVI